MSTVSPWEWRASNTSWWTNADAGVDTALPAAVVDLFRRGMEAGHATDSFSALVEVMGKPTDPGTDGRVGQAGPFLR